MKEPALTYEYVDKSDLVGRLDTAFDVLFEEVLKLHSVENPNLLNGLGKLGSLTLSGGVGWRIHEPPAGRLLNHGMGETS